MKPDPINLHLPANLANIINDVAPDNYATHHHDSIKQKLNEAWEDIEASHLIPAEEVFARLEKKYK